MKMLLNNSGICNFLRGRDRSLFQHSNWFRCTCAHRPSSPSVSLGSLPSLLVTMGRMARAACAPCPGGAQWVSAWGWLSPLSFPGDRSGYRPPICSDLPLETCLLSLGQIGLMLTSSTWERQDGSQAEAFSGVCSESLRPEISGAAVRLRMWMWAAGSLLLLLQMFHIQNRHLGKKQKQLGVCRGWRGTLGVRNYMYFGRGCGKRCWIFRHQSK